MAAPWKGELSARNSCSPSRDSEEAKSRRGSAASQGQPWTQPIRSDLDSGKSCCGHGAVTQGGVGAAPTAARADLKTLTTLRLQTQPSRAS